MKKGFWTADWFAGLIITIVVLVTAQITNWVDNWFERPAYDLGVRLTSAEPSDKIAIVAIDEESIDNLGRWPWPRSVHAKMIQKLSKGGAKVIGLPIAFTEPQEDPGLIAVQAISDAYLDTNIYQNAGPEAKLLTLLVDEVDAVSSIEGTPALQESIAKLKEFVDQSTLTTVIPGEAEALSEQFFQVSDSLDTDLMLADSMESANSVVLGMFMYPGDVLGNPDGELPEYVTSNAVPNVADRVDAKLEGLFPVSTNHVLPPVDTIGFVAAGMGHMTPLLDVDGAVRFEPLVLSYYDQLYPSLALAIAAKSLNLSIKDVQVNLGEGLQLGRLNISTDPFLLMNSFYYADRDGKPAFPIDSYYDVIEDKIPVSKYANKIVLIGPTALGLGDSQNTPVDPNTATVLLLAHTISSILEEDFFVSPAWANWARMGITLLVILYLLLLLPRMRAGPAFMVSLALLVVLIGVHLGLMTTQRTWLQLMLPATLLFLGHLLLTTKRFLMTERGKLQSEAESAESNRMLGLAYQGKGDLDQAFASFRKVPMDESVMDLLYNLALDFERRRQHNKAGAVYAHIAEFDANFRDLKQRIDRSRKLEETVMLGGAGASTVAGTLMLDGDDMQKPMLGRYQVEKELGKGAMGIVYLGRDPKINRVVAIKTMALSQEFEEDELDEVKERFFREAETAGRLNHPNIVTVFDAGEEHDLAYIAMEFLSGDDLAPYTKPDNLLPLLKVLEITALSADALATAHSQNVVHRDIKPANIMYDPEKNQTKLTDFGIARITDSSKTKTGMVLGTPSYMSPEQLSGKKVDGRSDLFSLGVMLYQMTSGTLPFKGDSMATLMFKIANEEHPDVLEIRADLPPSIKNIIDKALRKDADERYQTGTEMAQEIRECMATLGS